MNCWLPGGAVCWNTGCWAAGGDGGSGWKMNFRMAFRENRGRAEIRSKPAEQLELQWGENQWEPTAPSAVEQHVARKPAIMTYNAVLSSAF